MWRFVGSASRFLGGVDYGHIGQTIPGLQVGSVAACFAGGVYFVLLPIIERRCSKSARLFFGKEVSRVVMGSVEFSSWRWKRAAVVVVWAGAGLLIGILASYGVLAPSARYFAFFCWLMPLFAGFALAPLLLMIPVLLVFRFLRTRKEPGRLSVLRSLFRVLLRLPSREARDVVDCRLRYSIAIRLGEISEKIRRFEIAEGPQDDAQEWAARQFGLAADNLLVCGSWLYLPGTESVEAVRLRVLQYCKAFLTGSLLDLPRDEGARSAGLIAVRPKHRMIKAVMVGTAGLAYCMIPLALLLVFRQRFGAISVPDSILLLAYSIWIAIGLGGYFEHSSEDGESKLWAVIQKALGR